MLKIYNDVKSVQELTERYENIVLYGAGASCILFLKSFWDDCLQGRIMCVVDINEKLNNTYIEMNDCKIKILTLSNFLDGFSEKLDDIVFLLTPIASSVIVPVLDKIPELDGVKTYLLPMIANNTSEAFC